MKKKSFFAICVMAVALAATVTVVSCKKEKHDQNSNGNEQTVQTADNMDEYLMAFKKKLLSAEKGGETISLEQAERDLGNLLNFDFGDANYATDVFQHDTIHLKLVASNGQVDLSQLAQTYGNAIEEIIEAYQDVNLPEKSVYSISCVFDETDSKNGETKDVVIVLVTRGFYDYPLPPHDTLNWRPKNRAGTCDGQNVNLYGAPEIIAQWIADPQSEYACYNGGRVYYTEVDHWKIYGYKTYVPTTDKFRIYTSFEANQNNVCISHDDMEYYYHNILDYWNNAGYPSHEIIYVRINHCEIHNPYIYNTHYYNCYTWQVIIRHGKPNCTGTDPIPLE